MVNMRSNISSSSVRTIPPSWVVRVFEPWKLKVDATPKLPAGRPANIAPAASAESSTTRDPVAVAHRGDGVHVGHAAVEVDDDHRPRAVGDGGFERIGGDAPRDRIDVDEHGSRADVGDRRRRRDPRGVGDDDLVAGPDPEGVQREVQRRRARRQRQRVAPPAVGGELRFEAAVLGARLGVPGVARGLGDGVDLAFGDPRTRDRDRELGRGLQ